MSSVIKNGLNFKTANKNLWSHYLSFWQILLIIVFISNAVLADAVQTETGIWVPSSLLSPEFNSKKTGRQLKFFITQSFSNVTKSYLVTCYWKSSNLGEIWTLGLIVRVACKESPGTENEKCTFLEFLFHSFGQIFVHSCVSAQV